MKCNGCHSCITPCGRLQGYDTIFVVGNGVSRQTFDLHTLVGKGLIIGCNEAHKAFPHFDVVASIDGGSTLDIKKSFTGLHVYKWKNNWFRSDTNEDLGQLVGSFNSGQLALRAAVELFSPKVVYLIGIDFGGSRLYTKKTSHEPSNKCWETWDRLMSGQNVINVSDKSNINGKINGKTIRYQELAERLHVR